jgi:hypothetical protein
VLLVPLSTTINLLSSLQGGVSVMITRVAKNPCQIMGPTYQSIHLSPQHTTRNFSTQALGIMKLPSTTTIVKPQTTTTQLPKVMN